MTVVLDAFYSPSHFPWSWVGMEWPWACLGPGCVQWFGDTYSMGTHLQLWTQGRVTASYPVWMQFQEGPLPARPPCWQESSGPDCHRITAPCGVQHRLEERTEVWNVWRQSLTDRGFLQIQSFHEIYLDRGFLKLTTTLGLVVKMKLFSIKKSKFWSPMLEEWSFYSLYLKWHYKITVLQGI